MLFQFRIPAHVVGFTFIDNHRIEDTPISEYRFDNGNPLAQTILGYFWGTAIFSTDNLATQGYPHLKSLLIHVVHIGVRYIIKFD